MEIEFRGHDIERTAFPWQKDSNKRWHVRRPEWSSDVFDVVTSAELQEIENVCKRFAIIFTDLDLKD